MSASRVRLPADIEMEDRLAFGLTARQLVILGIAALVSYAVYATAGSVLPLPVAVALATPTALAGVALALGRLAGLSGDRIALAAARHLTQSTRRVAGEQLPGRLVDAPEQPAVSLLRVPVKAILQSGVVELTDGTSALLLVAAGTNWALRSQEEQEALSDAYAKWLNSLVEPTTITVRSEPVDLTGQANAIEDASRALPHPALRRCAHTYAQFLAELAREGDGLRRRQILVVLSTRSRKRETAKSDLERRASETTGLLAAAGVELEALDGKRAAALLLGALEPPGPPAGSHMDGGDPPMLNAAPRIAPRVTVRAPAAQGAPVPAPSAVEVERDWLRTGEVWQRTLAVVGYPREVAHGWLAPLLRAAGELDLALHIGPVPPALASDRLRRQRARLESSRRIDADRGRVTDPALAAAVQDADELAGALARGESRLFRSGVYLSVSAGSREELEHRTERVKALCASMLLHTVPATFRPLDGWLSTLPLGTDRLGLRRTFDTAALAAGFPFASADPPLEDGVLYGVTDSGAPVLMDRFARTNFNSVTLAYSGAGKSYKGKLEALRLLYRGVQVFILDPEDEYHALCEAVGGAYLPLTGARAVAINALDLPEVADEDEGRALDERILFLADLIELLVGGLDGGELAVLDRSARAAYQAAGITSDPATHRRPAPLLADLVRALQAERETGRRLAERLSPYAAGSHSSLFDRPTSVRPDSHLVCFSLRGLPERMRAPALMLALDAIWRSLEGPLRRRVVLVDEAWDLMRETPRQGHEAPGARFLYRLAKKARKRWTGLTTITQDPGDLLDSPLGQAVVNNACEHFLLRQSPQAIERVGQAFALTTGERRYLLACPVGSGLLIAGEQRIPLTVKASPAEHELVTSDPAELAKATA